MHGLRTIERLNAGAAERISMDDHKAAYRTAMALELAGIDNHETGPGLEKCRCAKCVQREQYAGQATRYRERFTEQVPAAVVPRRGDAGDIRGDSQGGPFPWIVVAVDNPTGLVPGLYWYVQLPSGERGSVYFTSADVAGDKAAQMNERNQREPIPAYLGLFVQHDNKLLSDAFLVRGAPLPERA
jgi:hypothetical protein